MGTFQRWGIQAFALGLNSLTTQTYPNKFLIGIIPYMKMLGKNYQFELGVAQTYLRLQGNQEQSAHNGGCKTSKSGNANESLRAII